MSRFVVVDFADAHGIVDTEAAPTEEADLGEVVWRGDTFDRTDLDASWAAARAAEVECNRRNVEAPADRQRPTEPPPSIEEPSTEVKLEGVSIQGNTFSPEV